MGVALTIWDSFEVPSDRLEQVYTWNGYSEKTPVYSLLRYIDIHSERLRRKYLAWVHELGESLINGKRLIDIFALEDGLSYWWMTPFVEKNPWKSPAIIDAIRIFALEEIIVEQGTTKVILVSSNKKLHEIFKGLCRNLNISYEWEQIQPQSLKTRDIKYFYKKMPNFIQGFFTLTNYISSRWLLKNKKYSSWFNDDKTILICSYFFHLDVSRAEEGEFYSHYWGELGELLNTNHHHVNWLQLYTPCDDVPNADVAKKWVNNFNQLDKDREFHAFLDRFLSWKIVLRVVRGWIKIWFADFRLSDVESLFCPHKSHFTLWPIMHEEWASAMSGSCSIMNYLWIELFDEAMKNIPHQEKGFYLLENQGWERAFIHAWRKYDHGKLVGVTHSTIRFWDLRYYNDPRTITSSNSYAILQPDLTALNGKAAVDAFLSVGFPIESIVECEALRFGYLNELKRKNKKPENVNDIIKVLVLGDYIPAATIKMMRLLEDAAPYITSPVKYTIKYHPNYHAKSTDYPSLNYEVVTNTLGDIMQDYDIAYTSNMTSAAVDAYLAGLQVVIMLDDLELNFSPLRNQCGVHFVNSSVELSKVLNIISCDTREEPAHNDFFFLDPELSRWQQLL